MSGSFRTIPPTPLSDGTHAEIMGKVVTVLRKI